jgi:hypothetical protein
MPATQDSRKIAESIPATDLIGVLGWEQLRDPSKYVRIARVPMIDEHDHPRKGKVDKDLLEIIADNTNERCDQLLFPLLMLGHTFDGDDEQSQPVPVGVLANFRVEDHHGKKCLFADEFVQVDKIDELATFPRRSIERVRSDTVPENNWIDCVAALRQPAQRPIALVCKYGFAVPAGATREQYSMDLSDEQYNCGEAHDKKPVDREKVRKGLKAIRAKYAGSGLQMQAGSAGLNPITDPQPNVSALPRKTRKQEDMERGVKLPGPPEMGVGEAPDLAPPPEKIQYAAGHAPIDFRSVRRGLSRIRAKRRLGIPEGKAYRGPSVNTKALGQSRTAKAEQDKLAKMDEVQREQYLLGSMALGAAAVAAKPIAKIAGKVAGAVAPEGVHAAAGAVKNVLPKAKPPAEGEEKPTPSPANIPHWLGEGQKESGEVAKKGAQLATKKGAGILDRAAGVAAAGAGAVGYLGAGAAKKVASMPGEVGKAFAEGWKSKDPTREIHWTEHPQFAGVKSGIDRAVAQTKGWKKDPATGRMARDPERAAQASQIISHQIDQILSGELDPRNADPLAASAAKRVSSDPSHVGFGQIRARPAKGAQAPGSAREIDAFFGQQPQAAATRPGTPPAQPQPQAGPTPQPAPQGAQAGPKAPPQAGPQVGPAGRSATMGPQQPPQQPQAPADPFANWMTDSRIDKGFLDGVRGDPKMLQAVDDIIRRGGFGKGYGVPASQAADFRATAEALATHIKQSMGDANAKMPNPKAAAQTPAAQPSPRPAPNYQPNPQQPPAQAGSSAQPQANPVAAAPKQNPALSRNVGFGMQGQHRIDFPSEREADLFDLASAKGIISRQYGSQNTDHAKVLAVQQKRRAIEAKYAGEFGGDINALHAAADAYRQQAMSGAKAHMQSGPQGNFSAPPFGQGQQSQPQQPAAQPGIETVSMPTPKPAPHPATQAGVHVIGEPDARGKQTVRVVTDQGESVEMPASAEDAARVAAGDPVALKHFKEEARDRIADNPSIAGPALAPPPPGPRSIPAKPGAVQAGLTDEAGNSHAVEFPSTAAARLYEYAKLRQAMDDPNLSPQEADYYRRADEAAVSKFREAGIDDRDTLHAMSLKYAAQVNRAFEEADYLGTSDRPVMAPDSDALGDGFDDDLPEEYQDSDSPLAGAARAMGAPFGKSPQQAYADMRMSERKAAPDPSLARLSTGIMAGSGNFGVYGFDPYTVSTDSVSAMKAARQMLAKQPAKVAKQLVDEHGDVRGIMPQDMNEYHWQQAGSTDHEPGWVGPQVVDIINTAPVLLQYKLNHDLDTGATGSISEPYDHGKAKPVLLWKATKDVSDPFDPSRLALEKGKVYVVDGHNQLDAARRSGAAYINAIYSGAKDHGQARAEGAMRNMLGGAGSPVDSAGFIRELMGSGVDVEKRVGDFSREHGVSPGGHIGDAMVLANLPDSTFSYLVNDSLDGTNRLPISAALKIGRAGISSDAKNNFSFSYVRGDIGDEQVLAAGLSRSEDWYRRNPESLARINSQAKPLRTNVLMAMRDAREVAAGWIATGRRKPIPDQR